MSVSPWDAASAGEYIVAFVALKVLWICTLVGVKRRKDPLRLPFLWLKWAISLYLFYVFLKSATLIMTVVIEDLDTGDVLWQVVFRMYDINAFFSSIADVVVLLCLVELALSFLRALGNDSPYYRIIRYSDLFLIAILFVLAIAALGEDEAWVTNSDYGNSDVSWATTAKLYGAYGIIYWIASLAVVFLSSFVLYSSMRKKHMRSLARRFLAASLLNLTRSTWEFYYAICYFINYDPLTYVPQYITVVDPILYAWVTVSIFGLLMAIGFRKRNGLWSDQQQPHQQGIIANSSVGGAFTSAQGQGIPPSPAYVLYQQPTQAELTGHAAPPRPELPGAGSLSPNRQYYWTQHQQQSPFVQNQTQNAVEVADGPYRWVPIDVAQQQPQVTQLYEVAGNLDQKT